MFVSHAGYHGVVVVARPHQRVTGAQLHQLTVEALYGALGSLQLLDKLHKAGRIHS